MNPAIQLRVVRVVHTVIWAWFAGCIVAIPIAAASHRLRVAVILIGIVSVEVAILVANRMRCPLTDVAGRYTPERRDNFDIYLPLWLARYNKHIFGSLFVVSVVYTLAVWRGWAG